MHLFDLESLIGNCRLENKLFSFSVVDVLSALDNNLEEQVLCSLMQYLLFPQDNRNARLIEVGRHEIYDFFPLGGHREVCDHEVRVPVSQVPNQACPRPVVQLAAVLEARTSF